MTSSNNGVRLQKVLAQAGVASRRKAEAIILEGRVKVNGVVVKEMGQLVLPNDKIEVDNKDIGGQEAHVYYIINKPRGVVSTSDDQHDRPTVIGLIHDNRRIYPVGRLDMDTTGALILTNDGAFAQLLTHPKYDVPKTYRVSVDGKMKYKVNVALEKGLVVDGVEYAPMKVSRVRYIEDKDRTVFDITLHEGKNRQIRKLMEHFDLPVIRLHRYAIGDLEINDLQIGSYRVLKPFEVKKLRDMARREL
jgi:23S rRNA pseudouridine2605 synthase